MRKQIVIASYNIEKRQLFKQIANEFEIDVVTPPNNIKFVENGKTYLENATEKATKIHQLTKIPTFADDYGIEIHSLNCQPGVFTRRWGGKYLSDEDLLQRTIDEIKQFKYSERQCDFIGTGIIIADTHRKIYHTAKDSGVLLLEPRGELIPGHPLASLLYLLNYKKTLAELKAENFESKDIRIYRYLIKYFIEQINK